MNEAAGGPETQKALTEVDLRIKREVDYLREFLTFEDAIQSLARYRIFAENTEAAMGRIRVHAANFIASNNRNIDTLVDEAIICAGIAESALTNVIVTKEKASKRGKTAADALHSKPGGSHDKKAAILAIWATGKYWSRDLCAEEECAGIGLSYSKTRKHLIGTPDNPMPKKA